MIFDQFFQNVLLPKSLVSFFEPFIPKIESSLRLRDFIFISILNSSHKLVAKTVAFRLISVVGKLIFLEQSTFVKRKQLVDGMVALNYILDIEKVSKSERKRFVFKMGFEKTYDYLR